ncbi:MAG TPA: DUF3500 domain-containing protein, partial [Dehalococcoidia bacterium]|nr:DUF3500 domain-containing protein [Dehalococcoidia bacterium]
MAVARESTTGLANRMSEAASAWLDALQPEQRAKASLEFDDVEERTSWAYFPRLTKGLPLLEMDPRQQKLAHALVAASLRFPTYAKVTTVMACESLVSLMEGGRLDAFRDPRRYFLAIFGSPGNERWGWRFEGHHVVLNFTLADGEVVSPTPLFIGAQPAEVSHGHATILRPCAEEEDAARELLGSLDAERRRQAIICEAAPPDFVIMNAPVVPETALPGEIDAPPLLANIIAEAKALPAEQKEALRFERERPRGIPASGMDGTQQMLLAELIAVYVDRLPEPLAGIEHGRIERAGIDGVHFAWAGETERRRPHYYRLQGPTFLVEYDNTQNDANHLHSVWRDPERDFGGDLLREHLGREH